MKKNRDSHWPVDDEGHHHIHVCDVFLQVRIGQVQLGASGEEDNIRRYQQTASFLINVSSCEHTLVHVGFLGVHMDYSIHHLASISRVWRHVPRVLIVIGVCLRNRRVDGGVWENRVWI